MVKSYEEKKKVKNIEKIKALGSREQDLIIRQLVIGVAWILKAAR